jgi:hypothetical protein
MQLLGTIARFASNQPACQPTLCHPETIGKSHADFEDPVKVYPSGGPFARWARRAMMLNDPSALCPIYRQLEVKIAASTAIGPRRLRSEGASAS